VCYILCGISDIADGYVARKTKSDSQFGALLDSIADFIFIAAMLVVFIPMVNWDGLILYWIAGIGVIRFVSLIVGAIKYKKLAFLHTYANKVTGLVLFFFPILYVCFDLMITASLLCSVASISAMEELLINVKSRTLNRNVTGLFVKVTK
jgi:CDP-diacylglycerol--glycerol-3-phosphate 3-phosphatidyltransferase